MYDPDEHMEEVDVDPVRELKRLYIMIEDWIGGIRGDLTPLTEALAEEFVVVTPDGVVRDREAYLEAMRDAGERYRDSDPPYVIDVRNATLRRTVDDRHLVTYEMLERVDGDWQAKTNTVWIREVGPAGIELLHLHQTWLDAPEEAAAAHAAEAEAEAEDEAAADSDAESDEPAAEVGSPEDGATDEDEQVEAEEAESGADGSVAPVEDSQVDDSPVDATDEADADRSAVDADATAEAGANEAADSPPDRDDETRTGLRSPGDLSATEVSDTDDEDEDAGEESDADLPIDYAEE